MKFVATQVFDFSGWGADDPECNTTIMIAFPNRNCHSGCVGFSCGG
jgi:hypothetical protein